ncbi:hypothetical protein AB0L06_11015 [Spirillospora sp. NPDC052269]
MRKRIIRGLATAALPIAALTAPVSSWPHLPPFASRAMASDGRTHSRRSLAAARDSARTRAQASPRVRAGSSGRDSDSARTWVRDLMRDSARKPEGRQTIAPFVLGDLPDRLSELTSRMARAVRGVRLTQSTAERMLFAHHVRWRSNGHCHDRANPSCTSFEGLLHGSLDDLFAFGRLSGCPLTVSGGTEHGHARGRLSHGTGHKIDVMPTACLDRFIPRRFRHIGLRGDNAELYRSHTGVVFAREPSHWDILMP